MDVTSAVTLDPRLPRTASPGQSRQHNSFDIIRCVAAAAVIIGHHADLSGNKDRALPVVKDTLPGLAVCVFFSISGFLIYNSLKRDRTAASFFSARLARLLPNLIFALVTVSAVMMIWFKNYSEAGAHIGYVLHNLLMFFHGVQYTIPGVLEGRPLPGPNGSLWTLPYEFWLYVLLFAVFRLRSGLREACVLLCFGLSAYQWTVAMPGSFVKLGTLAFQGVALGKLGTYFFAGASLAAVWPRVATRKTAVSLVVVPIAVGSAFVVDAANPALAIAIAWVTIMLGLGTWGAWFKKGDPSYGMYIFGFPVQQLALLTFSGFYVSLFVSLVVAVAIGYGTYWAFERRCIAAKGRLAEILAWPFG